MSGLSGRIKVIVLGPSRRAIDDLMRQRPDYDLQAWSAPDAEPLGIGALVQVGSNPARNAVLIKMAGWPYSAIVIDELQEAHRRIGPIIDPMGLLGPELRKDISDA